MNYSQGGEQAVVLELFGDFIGNLLDCGAADGRQFSNSLALIERGWSGVLLEPSPAAFTALTKLHGANEKLHLVNQPVGLDPHKIKFYDTPDLVGTTQAAHREKWEKSGVPFTEIEVLQITFAQICERYGEHYDFINIDTEGTSADLFLRMPIERMNPRVVCVEHDDRHVELSDYARSLGFHIRYLDGNNAIYFRP